MGRRAGRCGAATRETVIDVLAVGRERTEAEKLRRHLHGDKGATFSRGKRMCLLVGG